MHVQCSETILSEGVCVVPTQSTLCLSDDILFSQVKLLFVGQVSPLHV